MINFIFCFNEHFRQAPEVLQREEECGKVRSSGPTPIDVQTLLSAKGKFQIFYFRKSEEMFWRQLPHRRCPDFPEVDLDRVFRIWSNRRSSRLAKTVKRIRKMMSHPLGIACNLFWEPDRPCRTKSWETRWRNCMAAVRLKMDWRFYWICLMKIYLRLFKIMFAVIF